MRKARAKRFPIEITWSGDGGKYTTVLLYHDFHAACRDGVSMAQQSKGQLLSLKRMPEGTEPDYTS